jgi:hypothetical protein
MYASLYQIPKTSILDNRKFFKQNSLVYEAPPKLNKYVPDETIEEKVNYSYGPHLRDNGAGDVYSYRYNANYAGNRDVDNGISSILDVGNRPYNPVSVVQYDRNGKDKISKDVKDVKEEKSQPPPKKEVKEVKESYQETKPSVKVKVSAKEDDSGDGEETCTSGTCSADSDGVKNVCGAGAGNLFPIMDPRFNLREAAKNMILLEDHLFQKGKRCQDCILKHCLTIEGFLEEGITLDIDGKYTDVLQKAFDEFRLIFVDIAKKIKKSSLTNEDCYKIAQTIRKIRKPLCQNFATFV